jgi:PAS domain S-box-containing protein
MNSIRVIIIEDSENDAMLIGHELKRGGFEPSLRRVETAEELVEALDAQTWDLILSDFSLPQFSGPQALSICLHRGVDVPFIVVSGRIGEETAVEMMKAGAHDYVRKDTLTRLVPAVTRELRAARERRGRKRAEAMMTHLASVVESCDDAIFSQTLHGTVLSWNAAAERIFGFRADEIIGQPILNIVPDDYVEELEQVFEGIKKGQRVTHMETLRVRKDGRVIDASLTISPVKDSAGRIVGASVVSRDITERRQAEKERLQLIQELTEALARVKTLSGLLPICASCKKIRNDQGYWEQVEIYIKHRSNADFTHGICPDCACRLYPEIASNPNHGQLTH